ncbi:MAG: hypothetical protein Q9157_004373 [Trypethelium eluteriae]
MLSWISGPRLGEEPEEDGNATICEVPETPAPVFAVRAFKHALFGTPQAAEHNPNTTLSEGEDNNDQPPRNSFTHDLERRPVSGTVLETTNVESSPVKPASILMTPGMGAARRKTVSFGAQVANNEGKKSLAQSRSGLPNHFPGKFPSPWTPKNVEKSTEHGDHAERAGATKLTKSLFDARESRSSKPQSHNVHTKDERIDRDDTISDSGVYWKQEYEQYAAKTKQEMKKLLKKQRLAKDFARQKDTEVTDLAGKLRSERKKMQKLEARTSELEVQMREYRDTLTKTKEELESSRQKAANQVEEAQNQPQKQEIEEMQEQQRKTSKELREAREESSVLRLERDNLRQELDEARRADARHRRARNRTDNDGGQAPLDLWADAVGGTPASAESVKTIIRSSPPKQMSSATEAAPPTSVGFEKAYKTPPKRKSTLPEPKLASPIHVHPGEQHKTKTPPPNSSFDSSLQLPQPSPSPTSLRSPAKPEISLVDDCPTSPIQNDAMALPIRSAFPTKTQPISKPPRKNSVISKKETKKENVNPNTGARSNNKHNGVATTTTAANLSQNGEPHSSNHNLQVPATRPSTQIKTSTKENAVPQNTLARVSPGAPSPTPMTGAEESAAGAGEQRRTASWVARGGREVSEERFAEMKRKVQEKQRARKLESGRMMTFR